MNRPRFSHRNRTSISDVEIQVSLAVLILLVVASGSAPPAFGSPTKVRTEAQLRRAWQNPRTRAISLEGDIFLRACQRGSPIRESSRPLRLNGNGHTIRQTCFEKRLLRQDGTGFLLIENVTLTRGGNDGPGAAVTTRGEIVIEDSEVTENLAEEPGGAIFSQRRATIIRSVITGNLANDDGGGVYARRGGIEVYDSIISNNLVDGSGGALGSTGDILVVRSHVDGNTTDGDGGAIYTDEDGDVTVIDSTVDGNTADGPGGAIFTLEGDVTIINSTLNGNRADDRGGAISGEADVTVIDSTVARNAAFAHVGGGIWARSDLFVTNSTISHNYAEGQGGGVLAAGTVGLVNSTVADNVAPVAADVGAGSRLQAFGSIIGPPDPEPVGGQIQPIGPSCRVSRPESFGYNFVSDASCGLDGPSDVVGKDPMLAPHLADNGGRGETRMPEPGSPVLDRIPAEACGFVPFGYSLEGEQHLGQFGIDPLAPIAADQRGVARPQGAGCDVGAVELEVTAPTRPTSSPQAKPATAERLLDRIERMIKRMERTARRWKGWAKCVSEVPVVESGDPDHEFGFQYDELDGTGLDLRPALAIDRTAGRRPNMVLFRFSRRGGCRDLGTEPTQPGTPGAPGTADPAKLSRSRPVARRTSLRALEERLAGLEKREARLERMSEQFDEWESCLSWIPVTEYGDPEGRFGYLYQGNGGESGYRPALAIDRSEWDDPDYMFLGGELRRVQLRHRGGDETETDSPPPATPGTSLQYCNDEPGEAVDRPVAPGTVEELERDPPASDRLDDLNQDLDSFLEDVTDLGEPVEEFDTFDQCMHLIGVAQHGSRSGSTGYAYGTGGELRPALAMDMRGFKEPEYEFLAFPGEEPPSIECNEDAGGLFTN